MDSAEFVDVFVESNQGNHRILQLGPQQDLRAEGSLLEAVHLALQEYRVDNMVGHPLLTS